MPTRQELYDRIRASSKDEVVLEEMIRLGFWPARSAAPFDPAEEIRRRGEIERQLAALRTEQSRLRDVEGLKKELRRRRLAESKKKQAETKERRERERAARAAAWAEKKKSEIVYLGRGYSAGLGNIESKADRLRAQGLPVLETAVQLAAAMGLGVPELRFLAFSRGTATRSHYVRFLLPKRTGGTRLISAPMPRLKAAQRWILDNIVARVAAHDAAHGFLPERSIVTNATPHVGAAVVVNLDLQDFFPTVRYTRVRGLFAALGYGELAATVFALLSTEPDVDEVELDGSTYYVAAGPRHLPQGSPTSPAITNLLCRRLDRRLLGAARALGFAYTRYADDLTFSAAGAGPHDVGRLLRTVRWIVGQEGFAVHPKKTRVLRRGRQQEVTGVVVNDRPSVDRATLRRFRALLFQLDKDGATDKSWGESPDVFASAIGYANYVAMVDPDKGKALVARARQVAEKHGWKPKPSPRRAPAPTRAPTPAPQVPPTPAGPEPEPPPEPPKKKKWWKLF
jgi:retron-type reverse transcriptase